MVTHQVTPDTAPSSGKRWAQVSNLFIARLLLLGTLVQTLAAGVAIFGAGAWGLSLHQMVGPLMGVVALLLPLLGLFGRLPRAINWISLLLFVLLIVQTMLGFMGRNIPFLGALHPLNAMILFAVNIILVTKIGQLTRPKD